MLYERGTKLRVHVDFFREKNVVEYEHVTADVPNKVCLYDVRRVLTFIFV